LTAQAGDNVIGYNLAARPIGRRLKNKSLSSQDNGNAHEVGDGSVPDGLEDKAYLAQSNCPEIAIEVTEE
jgi:hypothetical protein